MAAGEIAANVLTKTPDKNSGALLCIRYNGINFLSI
jgi:hypothetical protein